MHLQTITFNSRGGETFCLSIFSLPLSPYWYAVSLFTPLSTDFLSPSLSLFSSAQHKWRHQTLNSGQAVSLHVLYFQKTSLSGLFFVLYQHVAWTQLLNVKWLYSCSTFRLDHSKHFRQQVSICPFTFYSKAKMHSIHQRHGAWNKFGLQYIAKGHFCV